MDRTRHIGFVLATGEQDHLVQDTRHFAGVLRGKGLNVVEEIWGGVFGRRGAGPAHGVASNILDQMSCILDGVALLCRTMRPR